MSDMGAAGEQQFCLRWNNHQANFIQAFEGLLMEETFADVTLAVEGVVLKCHKMVLAACSAYFKTLFSDVPCSHPVVFLKDVKVTEMRAILEYVYKGEVNVARNDLAAMLKVAQMLQIKGLMNTDSALPPSERPSPESLDERPNEEAISTSTTSSHSALASDHGTHGGGGGGGSAAGHSSPPHSTSSPYYGYGKSAGARENGARFPLPVWALAQGLPLVGQNPAAVSAALHPSLAGRHSSIFGSLYESATEAAGHGARKGKMAVGGMMRNHDTPILRGVLGQVHADSSQAGQHVTGDVHEAHYRSHSNGSADNGSDGRRSSMDLSNGHLAHSPYATGASMMDEDEKKPSPQSFNDDKKAAIANYVPSQKPEWKRYKQYTRADIANAIAAVRGGLSALQAARKFGVPSRTLYDKVKKLGITTSRPGRRTTNGSGACFPYGVGGNVNGGIYDNISENDTDNGAAMMENPASVLETSYAESRDNSMERETMMEQPRSPSPPLALCYQPPPQQQHQHQHQQQQQQQQHHQQQQQQQQQQEQLNEESDNEVEDLSVTRRSDIRVIMPPSVAIKEEA